MNNEIDVGAFRNEMSDRLIAIANKLIFEYCISIAEGNIEASSKSMKIIRIMEEASECMKNAPIEELADMLKYYSDQMDKVYE
jgi:hypothetical protein